MEKSSIAIIIPSYEPTEKLCVLIRALRDQSTNPIIIVNDGSDPEKFQKFFEEAASIPSVKILNHEKNYGKGKALRTAFSYCLSQNIPAVITADSDGQHLPEDILRCMDALVESPDSLVLGVRDFQSKNVPFKSKFGNQLTCSVFKRMTGRSLSDTQTGLRGISADFMKKLLDVPGDRFEYETKMLWEAVYLEIPYKEVKISTVYEDGNSGTHFRPIQDSFLIYKIFFGRSFLQFLFFTCSGLVSFIVDIGMFSLFFYLVFKESENLFLSVVFARLISSLVNYMLNRNLVFRKDKKPFDGISLLKYALLCFFIMSLSYGLTKGALYLFNSCNASFLKACVDILLFFVNFAVQKFLIFNSTHRK